MEKTNAVETIEELRVRTTSVLKKLMESVPGYNDLQCRLILDCMKPLTELPLKGQYKQKGEIR